MSLYEIVITFHSIYDDDKEISKDKTSLYLKSIIDNVDNEFLGDYLEEINESRFSLASFPKFKEYVLKKY